MQGRPKGVHFTHADMLLRNKTERLTNTALPALGVRWKKQVWHGMECSYAEWNNGLLLLCGAGSLRVKHSGMNRLEAKGVGWIWE